MEEFKTAEGEFPSSDKKSTVKYTLYKPRAPIAVCHIVHGMCEYSGRYAELAEFLCSKGVAVVCPDMLGHGRTAASDSELGHFDDYENIIDDQKLLFDIVRKTYRSLPYIMLGHSMGSFIARAFVTRYTDSLDGAVFCGTSGTNKRIKLGIFLAKLIKAFKGAAYHSEFLRKQTSGEISKSAGENIRGERLSNDDECPKKFENDKYCSVTFSVGAYLQLFELLNEISSDEWASEVPKSLPILLMSGSDDPVGGMSAGVHEVCDRLEDAEVNDVRLKLYEGYRHEVLNETNHETIWNDLFDFISDVCEGVRAAKMDAAYQMSSFARPPENSL